MSATDQAPGDERFDFRPLLASDVPGVMALYRVSILPLWLKYGRDHDLSRVEDNIREHIGAANYEMVVALDRRAPERGPVGYYAWDPYEDHTSWHTVAHLRMILVHPEIQGAGLGAEMIRRFEQRARAQGCTKVLFDVITGSPARAFYDRQGFRHWSDYMEKVLDEPVRGG